ncbi:MAG TPA: hypothetical protein VN372_09480 [Methanospirillum sp.]|nr:hypothetical protein [Methanospirillum sp.]
MTGIDLVDYATSPLNPALKIIVFLLYVIVICIYLDTRKKFGGKMQVIIDLLLLFSLCMAAGSLLRYFGHGIEFGFTEDYSLKWFQSLAYLAGAGCYIFAAYNLLTLFRRDHE